MTAPKAPAQLPASFSSQQAEKAVDALLAHHASVRAKREETELIVKDEHVWLVVNTKREGKQKKLLPTTMYVDRLPSRDDKRHAAGGVSADTAVANFPTLLFPLPPQLQSACCRKILKESTRT